MRIRVHCNNISWESNDVISDSDDFWKDCGEIEELLLDDASSEPILVEIIGGETLTLRGVRNWADNYEMESDSINDTYSPGSMDEMRELFETIFKFHNMAPIEAYLAGEYIALEGETDWDTIDYAVVNQSRHETCYVAERGVTREQAIESACREIFDWIPARICEKWLAHSEPSDLEAECEFAPYQHLPDLWFAGGVRAMMPDADDY